MIIPDYWAEAHSQHKAKGKQITVKRFGWSNTSTADAQAMAQTRADEALRRIQIGESLNRWESKAAYNGAHGVPIREEVLSRHGETVITRNSYGAHCLNTPDVLFADIDFTSKPSRRTTLWSFVALLATALISGWLMHSKFTALAGAIASLLLASSLATVVHALTVALRGGRESIARQRLASFLANHASWAVRVYRTPAGLRLLATHQTFAADSAEVQTFFAAIGTDPLYVRMCINQRCFRARLTAKPWRIGIAAHMRPRPGIWPVHPERMPVRQAWVEQYEAKARQFSACRFVESLGSGVEHIDVMPVVELHDRESRALLAEATIA